MSSEIPDSNWTKPQLMGEHNDASLESKIKANPRLWGRPGYLTAAEADTYLKFKEVVDTRGGDFKNTVYGFGEFEGEVYALTRWCRARKYVFTDIIVMVEEATKCMSEARKANYYPEPAAALGCEAAIYQAQYPQVYSGFAKNGCLVFYSKVGILNIDAVECITTVANIVKYHWWVMMHDYKKRLEEHKAKNPDFKEFETVSILDMSNLTVGQLNSRTLKIIKEQSTIDSLCFPETMNKTYLVNSPRFFSTTWKLIRGWLDARTVAKVEVLSDRKTWEKKLLDYIDEAQLPADYGGSGPITNDTMEKEGFVGSMKRLHTEVLYLRASGSAEFDIYPGEECKVTVYTRSTTGATFTVSDLLHRTTLASDVAVKCPHSDDSMLPANKVMTKANIKGPCKIKVDAKTMGSRFAASSSNYLIVFSVE